MITLYLHKNVIWHTNYLSQAPLRVDFRLHYIWTPPVWQLGIEQRSNGLARGSHASRTTNFSVSHRIYLFLHRHSLSLSSLPTFKRNLLPSSTPYTPRGNICKLVLEADLVATFFFCSCSLSYSIRPFDCERCVLCCKNCIQRQAKYILISWWPRSTPVLQK